MHQYFPPSAADITATKDKLSMFKESDCAHVHVCVSKPACLSCVHACVALPLAALSVSQLCSGLSKQNSSQLLLPGFTEQEVDCFVSQGEPLRPRCCCLPLVWLWTLQLVRAVSRPVGNLWKEKDQKILGCVSGVNIHPRIKPTYRRKVEAASVLIKYSVFWLFFWLKHSQLQQVNDEFWLSL